ncbi:MAG: endolytic transglycosylase MltG [Deltaproteobacteria bacterium CG17_big_fil_post_rev_8_21_14_2_50_63_7]|nr:MAG: endolytic transglycosylase MltG [Deltaproteobacteria bacterium CG17_big_fil_post_rev_8_21_14_2_50_63_7]
MRSRLLTSLKVSLVLAVLAAVAFGIVWSDYRSFLSQVVDAKAEHIVVLSEGMSAADVVDALVDQGLVDSPSYLKLYLWRSQKGRQFQTGVFRIEAGKTVEEMIDILTSRGDERAVRLRVTPGMNLYELAEAVDGARLADRDVFLARATDRQFAAELGVPGATLEGYLSPGDYSVLRGLSVDELIALMHRKFRETWVPMAKTNPEALAQLKTTYGFVDHELITLASVVQKEVVEPKEAPVVARVILNRLSQNMKLQSDPTCVYPPLTPGEKPSPGRCRDAASAYSTYVIAGLPPGPIGAPGEAALRAVLSPYDGPRASELLYFVAKNDGSWRHYFSTTYGEHEKAVDIFLRKTKKGRPGSTPQPR